MSVKERIMTIRLMEKLQENPAYAKVLGVEICVDRKPDANDKKEK